MNRFPRLYAILAVRLLAFLMLLICGLSSAAQLLGGGAVIQYGLAAPDDRMIYVGVDVGHNLRLTRSEPLPAKLFSATDTAADGRQVVSLQAGGNVDVFLTDHDGSRRQLTDFTDFSPSSSERAARRANLYPAWSPDGTWITFISSTVNGRLDLYVVRPNGEGLHHLGDRIRVTIPYAPRWVTFDRAPSALWIPLVLIILMTYGILIPVHKGFKPLAMRERGGGEG
jgi:hypothetical protein